jgi:hypothetical protein
MTERILAEPTLPAPEEMIVSRDAQLKSAVAGVPVRVAV